MARLTAPSVSCKYEPPSELNGRSSDAASASNGPPVPRHVKKHRRGEDHRIESIEHAAMSLDHPPPVLDSAVALDRRHDEAAEESHQIDQQRDQSRLPRGERRDPP